MQSSQQSNNVGSIINPILQMRKLRQIFFFFVIKDYITGKEAPQSMPLTSLVLYASHAHVCICTLYICIYP